MRDEPLKLNPLLLPVSVPPLLVKSTEFDEANTDIGKASASKAKNNMRFISTHPPEKPSYRSFVCGTSGFGEPNSTAHESAYDHVHL
jgi:hypothetical protein